ncbi:MAG: prolyl oligopeptidase family serine peptidase [Actinomycetota bacterium]
MTTSFLQHADLSPDARLVAYATLTEHRDHDARRLWMCASDGSGRRELAVDDAGVFRWSTRDDVLAVVAPVDGVDQLHLVDVDGGVRLLTSFARGVAGDLAWSDDGREIAVAVRHDEVRPTERVVDEVDAMGRVDEQVSDIHLIEVATGASTRITDGPTIDRHPRWTSDGERIAFVRSYPPEAARPIEQPLWVDRSGAITESMWAGSANCTVVPLDDGRTILCASRHADRPRGVVPSLYVAAVDGELDDRTAGLDRHLLLSTLGDQPSAIEDPKRFVGVHADHAIVGAPGRGTAEVLRVALTGPVRCEVVLDGERGCHPLAVRGATLLFAESAMDRPPTLRSLDLDTGRETTVVDTNPAWVPRLRVTPLDVESNGDRIDAWFLRPSGAPAGPLPTVLIIHGGPYELFGHTYYHDAHVLADAGFGVVMANPHGSIGYGSDFARSIVGRPGDLEIDDLLAALDAAVAAGLADPDRLGTCGCSYGGFMSAHLVGRTDRFGAAVIENPMIELFSMRRTSDVGPDLLDEMLDGTPETAEARYRAHAPLTYAPQCTTPSLLVLGERDRRCPPDQGEQFHRALMAAGCTTEVVWLDEAAHADSTLGEHAVRATQNRALVDWMRRHLLA